MYELGFSLAGFGTLRRTGVKVSLGSTIDESASLKLTERAKVVTVMAEASTIDAQTNQVATTYDKDWVRNAPIARFSFFDLINAAPGVAPTTPGQLALDHVRLGHRRELLPDRRHQSDLDLHGRRLAVAEHRRHRGGRSALAGRARRVRQRLGGGVQRGDAPGLERISRRQNDGFPFHREKLDDATAQLSGPIKDKLWFFVSYQFKKDYKTPSGVDPRFFTREKVDRVFGKLNWQISANHKLAFGFHNDYYYDPFTPAANTAPSTIGVEHGDNPTPNLMYTGILSDKTVIEGRVSGFYGHDHSDPVLAGEPRVKPRFYDLDSSQVTGGVYYWYDNDVYQEGISAKLSHFSDDFLGGSHDFKFGVQWSRGGAQNGVIGYNDFILAYDYTDYYGNSYQRAYGYQYQPFSYGGTTKALGAFFDDTFRLSDRLTLNLGLRYDHNQAKVPAAQPRDQDGNPTGEVVPSRDLYAWNVWSPRVEFNLKLTPDGKTVLRGHYGRYYRGVIVREFSNNLGVSPHVTLAGAYDLATGQFIDPVVTESSQNLGVAPDLQEPLQ